VIVSFVKSEKNKPIEGMSLQKIAEKRAQSVVDTFCDILIDERAEAMNVTFWGEEVTNDRMQRLLYIRELYSEAGKMPIWPFDTGTLLKFIGSVILPLFIYTVEHVIRLLFF